MADQRTEYGEVLAGWYATATPGMITFAPPTGTGMVVLYVNDWSWEHWADAGDRFEYDAAHSGDSPTSLKDYLCSLSLPEKP